MNALSDIYGLVGIMHFAIFYGVSALSIFVGGELTPRVCADNARCGAEVQLRGYAEKHTTAQDQDASVRATCPNTMLLRAEQIPAGSCLR